MQPNTFIKRIQGHELEFNRQNNCPKYDVSIADPNQKRVVLTLEKDEKGIWTVSTNSRIPVWFNEISLDIHYAIEKNEGNTTENTVVDSGEDLSVKRGAPSFPIRLSCLY